MADGAGGAGLRQRVGRGPRLPATAPCLQPATAPCLPCHRSMSPFLILPKVCAALLQLCALSALTGRLGESDAAGEVSEITRGYGRLPEGRGYTGAWGGTLQRKIAPLL